MARVATGGHGTFSGFGRQAVSFFEELEADNSREWFAANRDRYEDQIVGPLRLLGEALSPAFGTPKLFRPFRDVRFSADKRPIKEQAGMVLTAGDGGQYYVQLSADGVFVAGGAWMPGTELLARFRSVVDTAPGAASAHRVLDSITGDGFALNDEGRLTGAPRGYRRDHPEIELLRQTSLGVGRHEEAGPWLYGPECVARVEAAWRVVGRWNAGLLGHVGAPDG